MELLKSITNDKRPLIAFQVTYRIAERRTPAGARQERYDALVEKLRKFRGAVRREHFEDAGHMSTSSWIIESRESSARGLARRLKHKLTAGVDLLEVVEVNLGNRFELTV